MFLKRTPDAQHANLSNYNPKKILLRIFQIPVPWKTIEPQYPRKLPYTLVYYKKGAKFSKWGDVKKFLFLGDGNMGG